MRPVLSGGSKEATVEEAVRVFAALDREFERFYAFGLVWMAWDMRPVVDDELHRFLTKRLSTALVAEIVARAALEKEVVRTFVTMLGASDGVAAAAARVGSAIEELLSAMNEPRVAEPLIRELRGAFLQDRSVPMEITRPIAKHASRLGFTVDCSRLCETKASDWFCATCKVGRPSSKIAATIIPHIDSTKFPAQLPEGRSLDDEKFVAVLGQSDLEALERTVDSDLSGSHPTSYIQKMRDLALPFLRTASEEGVPDLMWIHAQSFVDPIGFLASGQKQMIEKLVGCSPLDSDSSVEDLERWVSAVHELSPTIAELGLAEPMFSSAITVWRNLAAADFSKVRPALEKLRTSLQMVLAALPATRQQELRQLAFSALQGRQLVLPDEEATEVVAMVPLFNRFTEGSADEPALVTALSCAVLAAPTSVIEGIFRFAITGKGTVVAATGMISSLGNLGGLTAGGKSLIVSILTRSAILANSPARLEAMCGLTLSLVGTMQVKPMEIVNGWTLPALSGSSPGNQDSAHSAVIALEVFERICRALPGVSWLPDATASESLFRHTVDIAVDILGPRPVTLRNAAEKLLECCCTKLSKALVADDKRALEIVGGLAKGTAGWNWKMLSKFHRVLEAAKVERVRTNDRSIPALLFDGTPESRLALREHNVSGISGLRHVVDFFVCCGLTDDLSVALPARLRDMQAAPPLPVLLHTPSFRRNSLIALAGILSRATQTEFSRIVGKTLPLLVAARLLSPDRTSPGCPLPELSLALESLWLARGGESLWSGVAPIVPKPAMLTSFARNLSISISGKAGDDPFGCFYLACLLHSMPGSTPEVLEQTRILCLQLAGQVKSREPPPDHDSLSRAISRLPEADRIEIEAALKGEKK